MLEKKKREMIETELAIASNIQKSFLPDTLPECPFLDMSVFMKPAKHVGGDLYSVFNVDDTHLGVMLGDVSGKGVPAALFMAKSVSEFKFNSHGIISPAQVLTRLNDSLSEGPSSGLFVTVSYAIFSLDRKLMVISNGGHLPVLKVTPEGYCSWLDPEGGMAISLVSGIEFFDLESALNSGDIFVFYSDGISEAKNSKRQDYDTDRLSEVVSQARGKTANDIQGVILGDIQRFVGRAPQHDDMTLIVVKVTI